MCLQAVLMRKANDINAWMHLSDSSLPYLGTKSVETRVRRATCDMTVTRKRRNHLTVAPFLCTQMATVYKECESSIVDSRSWWIKDYAILTNTEYVPIRVVKRKKNKVLRGATDTNLRDSLVLRFKLLTISSLVVPLLCQAMMSCLSG